MSMNPRETTDHIKNDYREYITSILHVKDASITSLAKKAVEQTGFVKGPYLETTLPFVEGKSLQKLAEEGLISKEFAVMGSDVHYSDWNLRIHQEDALRKIITEERNMVVSTGTGSGKTECYLYPIFNSLMREKEAGTLDPGVRALLIFPMNALANDQQKKLRKLLKHYPEITFGRYTGETAHKTSKETAAQAEKRMHEEYNIAHAEDSDENLRESIPNEYMCREQMAETPPHILLTNYAMLEYMLLRPDTAPFFDNSSAKNWRFIVIDEAHTYKGANGTEIAFLLRRLKERIRHNMKESFRCIATSATLGSEDGKADLALFAQNLFGEPFDESDIITTKRIRRTPPSDGKLFTPSEYIALKTQTSGMSESEKGPILFDSLKKDLRLFRVYDALRNKPKRIEDVASSVFPDLEDDREKEGALIDLIELSAAAKKSEYESALLPARYHLFVKSLEGMFVQYYPQKMVYLDRKEAVRSGENTYSVFELANCQKCDQEYLVGKITHKDSADYFIQTSTADKPDFLFISNEDPEQLQGFDEDDAIEEVDKMNDLEKFHLCLACGRIKPFAEKSTGSCCSIMDSRKIVTVYNLKYAGKEKESNCCPCCGSTKKGLIKRFLTANQPATFAVAKSLYDAIPPRPAMSKKADDDIFDDIFADDLFDDEASDSSPIPEEVTDERGRKLLIFSDNRQEAAFFAGFFEKKYNLIMWRKVILQCLKDSPERSLIITDLINRVMHTAEKSGLFSFDLERDSDLTDDEKRQMAAHYVMQEFINPDTQTGLEGLGYIQIEPEPQNFKAGFEMAGLKGADLWNALRYLMDTLRQKGSVTYPEGIRATDDFFSPRNHVRYFRQQGSKVERSQYIYGFIPEDKAMNKRLSFMLKILDAPSQTSEENYSKAKENLTSMYNLLMKLKAKRYIIDSQDASKGTVYALNHAKWKFKYVDKGDTLFRCGKCGKVYGYSIKGVCPEMKCSGSLEPVKAETIQYTPYYSRLYEDPSLIPMAAREHTAQLSSKTAGEYQKDFEEGKINVLSCSTTFEMGVDVGELEATFLRNVPPETSNYIQRAGRAGRRTSSAAFSVTFSRRSSHDMTFYHDPAQIIAGKISSPILEIANEKIAERHLNSIIISWFFKKHPEFFRENAKRVVSFEDDTQNMSAVLKECLEEKPTDLLESIHNALPEDICTALRVDEWSFIESVAGDEGSLTKAITERSADIGGLRKFSAEAQEEKQSGILKNLGRAMAAEKLISTLESEPSINFLSANGVLPKYGFPIDTVSLDIISGNAEDAKKIDLSRDLKMAISEFAPPAQIVANGKVWRSHAINTIPNKSWPTYVYYECPKCKKVYPPMDGMVDMTIDLQEVGQRKCDYCDTLMDAKKFIIPVFGFSTQMGEKPKTVGDSRPSAYYSTQTQFWGIDDLTEKQKAEARDRRISFHGKSLDITYSPGGKLFVLNRGRNGRGLAICPRCGYANDPVTMLGVRRHDTKFKKKCGNTSFIYASLGHEFHTDILKIKLPQHIVNMEMPDGTTPKDQYLSTLFAILEGASTALDISRTDINGCVTSDNELILYDDTAGGSGFVKHIYNHFEEVLIEAKHKVSGICGCTEETSCYGCLRNYSNQFYHDEISRGLAYRYIDWILNASETFSSSPKQNNEPQKENVVDDEIGLKKSNYEALDTSTYDDTEAVLKELIEESDDEKFKAGLSKLLEYASGNNYEHPIIDDCIQVESSIWPELFWGHSHVALFSEEKEKQYRILKKYDWYCYMIDDAVDPEKIFLHVKKGD